MRNCQKSTIFDASKIYNFRMLQILRDFQKHTSRAEILDMIRRIGPDKVYPVHRQVNGTLDWKRRGLILFN